MQKRVWGAYLLVGVVAVFMLCLAVGTRLAFAADWQEEYDRCMSGADAPSMVTVVCGSVANAWVNGQARASETRWISDISGPDNNTVYVDENDQEEIVAVYRLRSYSGSYGIYGGMPNNFSYYNWFGAYPNQQDPSQALDWLWFENVGDANVLWRGVVSNINTWNVGGNANVRISIPKFKEYVEARNGNGSVEIIQNFDGSQTYMAKITINGCWENVGIDRYVYGRHYRSDDPEDYYECGGSSTWISLKVSPPPPPPEEEVGDADGEFKSTSSVTVPVQNDILSELSITSDYDGEATLKFSTDAEVTTVKFNHNMYYWNYFTWGADDTFSGDNTETTWKIKENTALTGNWSLDPFNVTSSPASHGPIGSDEVQVTLGRGETKKICRRNVYTHKYVKYYWSGYEESGYTYTVDSYGGGSDDHSMACVEITRPSDPGDPDNPGTVSTVGGSSTGVMMAGEDSMIGWNSSARGFETRRLRSYEAIRFDVAATVPYASGNVAGMARYRGGGVCGKFPNKTACSVQHSDTYDDSSTSRNESAVFADSIVVPDAVGSKVCAAIGWKYEYWVGYIKTSSGGQPTENWDHLSNQDYWYVHKAACSTVAKKPSAAVWNGGLFTNGGVMASRSYRYLSQGGRDLFGSWAEHLLVAGKTADTMGSGSTLSYGGKSSSDQICNSNNNNALLTIANADCGRLGYSGIISNSTLRIRLDSYLKNYASSLTTSIIGGSGWTGLNGTTIYSTSGDVTISGNITTNPGPYNSIYDLPQVVIFVDGDVNITSNVTEIDAWIIATGAIDTCNSFISGQTTADVVGISGSACTNQLIFNGPVMAEKIKLNRSFGSDPLVSRYGVLGDHSERYSPGEIFNLRADTYLWAYAQSTRYKSSFTETYTRELAPRY